MILNGAPETAYRLSALDCRQIAGPSISDDAAQAYALRDLRRHVPYGLPWAGRRKRWLNLARSHLLARDGALCADCARDNTCLAEHWLADSSVPFPLEVDHVVPLADDGLHSLGNLQLLCRRCHSDKSRQERSSRPPRPTKADKMAVLEANGWVRLGAKAASIRTQRWWHPAQGHTYRLDAAWQLQTGRRPQ